MTANGGDNRFFFQKISPHHLHLPHSLLLAIEIQIKICFNSNIFQPDYKLISRKTNSKQRKEVNPSNNKNYNKKYSPYHYFINN